MTDRNRFSIVCRDCGEVSHHDALLVKPGAMVPCKACGLLTDSAHVRPALSLAGPGFSATRTGSAQPRVARRVPR
jgi:hypothetical protein